MRAATLRPLLACMALIAATTVLPTGSAQIHQCNFDDVQVFFVNRDLRAQAEQGLVEGSGNMMAQFNVVGDNADNVEIISFNFGPETVDFDPTGDNDQEICAFPGSRAYHGILQNYRLDTDGSDGWFINLQTDVVPDGIYLAGVSAYDAQGNELGRMWIHSNVDNCESTVEGVDDTHGVCLEPDRDTVGPWPIVLPGDGVGPAMGFTLEFAEPLSALSVWLNGEEITPSLVDWDGRLWDTDSIPAAPRDFSATSEFTFLADCSTPLHSCEHIGEAYQWQGGAVNTGDTLTVWAADLYGNEVIKSVLVGSDGIDIGQLEALIHVIPQSAQVALQAGTGIHLPVELANFASDGAVLFPSNQAPQGWSLDWDDDKVYMAPGDVLETGVTVRAPLNATDGPHDISLNIKVAAGGEEADVEHRISVITNGGQTPSEPTSGPTGSEPEPESHGTSGSSLVVGLLIVLLGAFSARRR